ncbi:MAG: sulfatase-like hydrolase/transferase [Campylobacterota bacterium]|nr:sulfatase-like hydrolase/transferase [Campylobacterota bacterium]
MRIQFQTLYRQTFFALALSFIFLMMLRIWLYFRYIDDFASLTFFEMIQSFFMGFRVDMITLFTFLALPILMLVFPYRKVFNTSYRYTISVLWAVILTVMIFIIVGDILYFGFVHRHMTSELYIMMEDYGLLIDMALDFYFVELIVTIVFLSVFFYFFTRIFTFPVLRQEFNKVDYFIFFLIIVMLFLGVRQKLSGRPFGFPDAFAVSKTASGNLAINGFFSAYRSSKSKGKVNVKKIDVNATRKLLASERTRFISAEYPLMRQFIDIKSSHSYNIVIIMLESWSASYIDSFSDTSYQVTPNFDAIASQSLKFNNFYANGQRSIEGVVALFAGIVQPSALANIGWGLELNNLSYLGNMAKEHGYDTLSMQSSNRSSFHLDSISAIAGFDEYYGAQDMPEGDLESKERRPKFGTWDGNMFRLLSEKLNSLKEPFMSYAFTSTTHSPFYSPGKKWEKYPHSSASENGFLNTLYYSDAMLGEFFQRSKKEPWFDNTIFILTADHTLGYKIKKQKNTLKVRHHIPLLIYAPNIFEAKTVETLASQDDIFPTIIDILGWGNAFASTGISLFDKADEPHVYLRQGNTIGYVTDKGYLLHNGKDNVLAKGDDDSLKIFREKLQALDYTLSGLIVQNRWSKP